MKQRYYIFFSEENYAGIRKFVENLVVFQYCKTSFMAPKSDKNNQKMSFLDVWAFSIIIFRLNINKYHYNFFSV